MKKLTHELTYPGASLDQVVAMLADPAYREAVCDAQRVLRRSVSVEGAGAGMRVRQEQVQASTGIPGFAKKLVGDEITIVTEETWSSDTAAAVTVSLPGKPADMAGSISVVDSGGAVVEIVVLEISVSIPFVGGKVESLLVDLMGSALSKENEVGRTWLAT
ncbi:DUF2505 domain-containing protein [Nocardioides sp.]|uniref:DUF2505 domain-containing protein n=1 Tax=Nocardioides sp. TaxID=35761 RepID=UPI003D137933